MTGGFFDRQCRKDSGLFVIDGGDPRNGLSVIEDDAVMLALTPKRSDFSKMTDETLVEAVRKINHRPGKCLGYWTPHRVFNSVKGGVCRG